MFTNMHYVNEYKCHSNVITKRRIGRQGKTDTQHGCTVYTLGLLPDGRSPACKLLYPANFYKNSSIKTTMGLWE